MHHGHFQHAEHDRGGREAFGFGGPGGGRRGYGRRIDGGRGDGGRGDGGGRQRARRGAVQASILTLLAERPMNGYELITELETRSEGRWRPSPGAIYPALSKMEDAGLITSTEVGGKLQFELTARGRTTLAYYNEEQGEGASPPWGVPAADGGDLRAPLFELVGQARRLRWAGNAEQVARARAVLAEATTKLTSIADETASDDPTDRPAD